MARGDGYGLPDSLDEFESDEEGTDMKRFTTAIFLVLVLTCAQLAQAAEESQANKDFVFTFAPYAWLTSLNGSVGAGRRTANVNANFFGDLAKRLDFAAMVHADLMYRDTVGLLAEFNYSVLGDQASRESVSLDAQLTMILSDVAGVYRLGTIGLGDGASKVSFDLTGGVRIWSLTTRLDVALVEGPGRKVSVTKSWVDPTVGARVMFHLGKDWELDLRGGVGGFGLTSDITWDAMALAGYAFWEHGKVLAGYRAVGVNHSEGSGASKFTYDATLHGPVIGVAFMF